MSTIPDNTVGAMALDLKRRNADPLAIRLLRDAQYVEVWAGSHVIVLGLSVDDMDMMTEQVASMIRNAACRAGLASDYYTVRQELAPTAPGWRDRLAEITDWGDAAPGDDWALINERVAELRSLYQRASTPDDRGDVARRCRQLLISAANAVFRTSMVPQGGEVPKSADAKARFGIILDYYGRGSLDAKLSSLMDRTWDLAVGTLHHDDAGRAATFAVAQATILAIRTLGVINADLEEQRR